MKFKDPKLAKTKFFIEATSFEKLSLWKDFKERNDITNWVEDAQGIALEIGHLDKKKTQSVWLGFYFVDLYGKTICFYETTSRFNDSQLVEEWITKNYPVKYDNDTRSAMTDAMNFHHALHFCRDEK